MPPTASQSSPPGNPAPRQPLAPQGAAGGAAAPAEHEIPSIHERAFRTTDGGSQIAGFHERTQRYRETGAARRAGLLAQLGMHQLSRFQSQRGRNSSLLERNKEVVTWHIHAIQPAVRKLEFTLQVALLHRSRCGTSMMNPELRAAHPEVGPPSRIGTARTNGDKFVSRS